MSPGSVEASVISPPCAGAFQVFWKKLSPATIRLRPPNSPPEALVSVVRPSLWLTIAPGSTLISSLPASLTTASANAGWCLMVTSIGHLLRKGACVSTLSRSRDFHNPP